MYQINSETQEILVLIFSVTALAWFVTIVKPNSKSLSTIIEESDKKENKKLKTEAKRGKQKTDELRSKENVQSKTEGERK